MGGCSFEYNIPFLTRLFKKKVKVGGLHEEDYCFMTYLSGNWYKEQAGFIKKLKKIWAIIRNKDFYYSEIILNKKDWEEYKKWINEK